jgi:integrase
MVHDAWRRVLQREYEWRCGNWSRPPEQHITAAPADMSAPSPAPKDTRLSKLLAEWLKHAKAKQEAKNRARKAIRYLIDYLNEDRLADFVAPLDIDNYREEGIAMLPGDKQESRKNRPIREYMNNALPPDERMSEQTIYAWFQMLNAVFNWGLKKKLITQNPVSTSMPKEPKKPKNEREIYTFDELRKIEHHPLVSTDAPSPAWYWIFRIQKYTGMRPEEVAQLSIYDVRFDDPAKGFYIHVNAEPDEKRGKAREIAALQSIKTGDSRRIPIHPELFRLGFREYVASQSGPWLFPDLPHTGKSTSHGKFAAEFGEQVLKPLGLKRPNSILYTFRHTFKAVGDLEGMHPKALSAIMGHSVGRMIKELGAAATTERYAASSVYALLAQEIRRIKYADEEDDVPWTKLAKACSHEP